jgi:hypothetical protein
LQPGLGWLNPGQMPLVGHGEPTGSIGSDQMAAIDGEKLA